MKIRALYLTISALFLVSTTIIFPPAIKACRAPRPSPQGTVSGAEFIIRATASKYVKAPEGSIRQLNEPGDTEIEFTVEEIVKGENTPSTIILNGYLTDKDDFNDRPVPYDFVRPGGRGGSCSAYEYKQHAEFLLFLKERDGKLTISWYALAPTNEQLRSADDPWIIWVKEQVKSTERKDPSAENAGTVSVLIVNTLQALLISFGGAI